MNTLKLKAHRVIKNLNQSQMSEMLNMSLSSYCKKERGYVPFSDEEKMELVKILTLSQSEFIEIFFANVISFREIA